MLNASNENTRSSRTTGEFSPVDKCSVCREEIHKPEQDGTCGDFSPVAQKWRTQDAKE